MLYTRFRNYEEYREMFYRADGSKKNSILLDYYVYISHEEMGRRKRKSLQVTMPDLFDHIVNRMWLAEGRFNNICLFDVCNKSFTSTLYNLDTYNGVCEDGDINCIRYKRKDNEKIYKMKAGKFMRHLIDENPFSVNLPENVKIYMCEVFAMRWRAFCLDKAVNLTLKVESGYSAFAKIYNETYECVGDFGSCMSGKDLSSFYVDAVDASAAWLENAEGNIYARCVIYNSVHTEDGEVLRLAERQYSSNGDLLYQNLLVKKLIDGGFIDGYKAVGAGCSDADNFLDVNGKTFEDTNFWIKCTLDYEDVLSYQDSFKWYDMSTHRAYNYYSDDIDDCCYLNVTCGAIEDDRSYDEYHEEYGHFDTTEVYYDYRWIACDSDRLEDFYNIDGDWYHEDYVSICPSCGKAFLSRDGFYSSITCEDYCDDECRRDAEDEYKEEHPDEFEEDEDEE